MLSIFFVCISCYSQTSKDSTATTISGKSLAIINSKYEKLSSSVDKQSSKLLRRLQKQEEKLRRKLALKDSTKSAELFTGSQDAYLQLQNKLKAPLDKAVLSPLKEYIPSLDSTSTAMNYLEKVPGLPADKLKQVTAVGGQLRELQGKLQSANEIKAYIRQRQEQLRQQLSQYSDLAKNLKGISKSVYYYGERLKEYKAIINDRKKLEEKALATLREMPAFQSFFQKNSYLSQLFRMPGGNGGTTQALEGLQTRAQVQAMLGQAIGPASGAVGVNLQQQVQAAQGQLNQLKDKLNKVGGGNSDDIMPDFTPNQQKNKSFLQRLEYGLNMQTSGTTNFLPATLDIAPTVGYRFSQNFSAGIGGGYKIGLGRGWNHISLSNQGVSLRSYVDARLKGSIWLSGGFEYQYLKEFENMRQIKNLDTWQRSALLGLSKKLKVGKKKESKIQLLYDFLAGQQIPRGQAFKFRVGWRL
ncbi:hypothetical protein [Foetidibacter luteolus]|uniref:hypothetical protein n=1 Tax=Foetidibacter luteolus TaxID=2608880 RepID=UPI00129ADA3D|nr:hypothetical protein [Foetidibacter luteolus]